MNVNTLNKDHETALHIMVKRGRLSPAISLICHGVNVDVQNKDGSTALHYAVKVSFFINILDTFVIFFEEMQSNVKKICLAFLLVELI